MRALPGRSHDMVRNVPAVDINLLRGVRNMPVQLEPLSSDAKLHEGSMRPDGANCDNGDCWCWEEYQPAPSSDPLYYLQTRGHVGNSLLWWKRGRHGYTTDIQRAHVFTKQEAFAQAAVRRTEDFPWRKDYIDANLQHHVNSEFVSRDHVGAV